MATSAANNQTVSRKSSGGRITQSLIRLGLYVAPRGNKSVFHRIIISIVLIALARAAALITPPTYGWVIDHVSENPFSFDITVMWWLLGGYAVARASQQLFDEISEIVFVRVAQRAVHRAALTAFRHLHSLSLKFHLDRQTGGLTRAIERGAKGMEFLLTFALLEVIPMVIELLLVSVILWLMFGFYYAAITFTTVVIYSVFTVMVTEWRIKFRRRMNEADETAATRAVDSLLNYETVKYFNAERIEARRFSEALKRYEDAAVMSRKSLSIINVGQGLIIAFSLALIMGLAGNAIRDGELTIGSFVVVNTFLIQLYLPLNFLGYYYREIRQSLSDMERMFSLLGENPDVIDDYAARPLKVKGGEIEFDNVVFAYGERVVLKGVSFKIEAGKRVAMVGASGGGKSTVSKLLFRFYDPLGGEIRIDGQNIREVRQSSLRKAIAVVPQDTVLFNSTIAENIAYGLDNASIGEVREAARLAALDTFISTLPEGYETSVGERGLKLSGGEKQRVAIARAILKQPNIYLFDEATSALDSRTEKAIQRSLDEVSAHHTTLMIAHRLSTVVACDEILVLADGQIAERGTHRQLLKKQGIYHKMWQRQASDRKRDE